MKGGVAKSFDDNGSELFQAIVIRLLSYMARVPYVGQAAVRDRSQEYVGEEEPSFRVLESFNGLIPLKLRVVMGMIGMLGSDGRSNALLWCQPPSFHRRIW